MKINYWASNGIDGKKSRIRNHDLISELDNYDHFYLEVKKNKHSIWELFPEKEYKDITILLTKFFTKEKHDTFLRHIPQEIKDTYTQEELEHTFFELVKAKIFFEMKKDDKNSGNAEVLNDDTENNEHESKLISLSTKENVKKFEDLIGDAVIEINEFFKLF